MIGLAFGLNIPLLLTTICFWNSWINANFLAMLRHALISKITYDNDEDDDDEEEEKEENVDAGV